MQNKDNNDFLENDFDRNIPEEQEEEITPQTEEYEEPYTPPVHEVPKKKKKKRKRKRSRLPGVIILVTLILAVSVCLSLVIIAFGRDMLGIGKSDSTHLIVIPEGATTAEISELLKDENIINELRNGYNYACSDFSWKHWTRKWISIKNIT